MLQRNDIKKYLNLETSYAEHDVFLDSLIDIAEDTIKQFCGQEIEQTTTDYYFQFNGNAKLIPYDNCTALNNLYERAEPSNSWSEVTGYLFNNPLPSISYDFTGDYYKANITYGYSIIPKDILQVGNEMVVLMFSQSQAGEGNLKDTFGLNQKQSGISEMANTIQLRDLKPEWIRVLRKYRKIND